MISETKLEKLRIILAFRKYTRLGLPSENLKPFDAYSRIRGCCRSYSEACDLLAVYDTMRLLKFMGKDDVIKSVQAVYLDHIQRRPKKNDISHRVLRHAMENHCDERTVYRQLEYARKLYKMLREAC